MYSINQEIHTRLCFSALYLTINIIYVIHLPGIVSSLIGNGDVYDCPGISDRAVDDYCTIHQHNKANTILHTIPPATMYSG